MRAHNTPWWLLMGSAVAAWPAPALTALLTAPASSHTEQRAAPAAMLGKDWNDSLDPTAFLVSEKYDGVRALWDGQTLRFKSGRPIAAPAWFTASLPPVPLDGELWMGRGRFDRLSGAVRRAAPVDAEWRAVRYMVFDLPAAGCTFAQRTVRLQALLGTDSGAPAWVQAVAQFQVGDRKALQWHLTHMVADGGEGLVLHRANALWHAGRSDALRKLKAQPDEEATVVAVLPGKGRLAGRMGALLLQLPDGRRFALGTGFSDGLRSNPPAVGSIVTYRYRDKTSTGLPKFASFVRQYVAE